MNDETMLSQLAEVKGQLSVVMGMLKTQHESTQQLLTHQHSATNQRIDDLRQAMGTQHAATEKRIDSLSSRVGTLESNERNTALKAAGVSALMGGGMAALIAALKIKFGG
jgi:predicted  nucleic acid-binding Zn-ribbon protein